MPHNLGSLLEALAHRIIIIALLGPSNEAVSNLQNELNI